MFDSLNYTQLIQQPEFISKTDVQLFHNWVNDYPFVPVYRVLLVAKYQSLNHSDTAQYIEQAAFYVQDRKQLKNLLRKWSDLQVEPELKQEETIIVPINEGLIEEAKTEEEREIASNVKDIIEEEIHEEQDQFTPEEIIEELEKTDNLEEKTTIEEDEIIEIATVEVIPQEEKNQDTEKEIITESIQISPEENEQGIIEEVITEKEPVAEDFILEEEEFISNEDDIDFLKTIGKYEATVINLEVEKAEWILDAPGNTIPTISENDIIDAGLVNTDIAYLIPWINEFEFNYIPKEVKAVASVEIEKPAVTVNPAFIEIKEKTVLPKVLPIQETKVEEIPASVEEKTTTTNHSFDEWLSILEQKKNADENAPVFDLPSPQVFTEKELAQEKSNPIISDHSNIQDKESKQETDNVKQLAADSISYKNDMGTETLAKLYVLQGKTDLAISIYKKLMVKFPEKNSYFANQIKKIKK